MAVTEKDLLTSRRARPPRGRRARFNVVTARNLVQAAFALFLLWSGWRFYLFVRHFETGGATPLVARPTSVEAFLPISALVSLNAWLGAGVVDWTHPAAVVLFLAILGVAFLFKKAICAWMCPIGALSELLARAGRRVLGRNLLLPAVIDWPLRSLKYLILFFFVYIVVFAMSPRASAEFLQGEYNKIADVKMLYFFTQMGPGVATFLVLMCLLSIFVANFWCRYLCPYGALLGLVSLFSPLRIVRNRDRCIDCKLCTKACPNRIDVARIERVDSPECTSCLSCITACPRRGALQIRPPLTQKALSPWVYGALIVGVFFAVVVAAQLVGYWQTHITYADYAQLIPNADWLGHY
ncbi:MAG: 4Fe-4S binding protein [Chloroflexota bacterium]|nr:MAG: 4Fe-4S binding protein [Chloroflexota bacterium]